MDEKSFRDSVDLSWGAKKGSLFMSPILGFGSMSFIETEILICLSVPVEPMLALET